MESLTFKLENVVKSSEGYDDFEGPLDLILNLLSKNKIQIKDIVISDILDQYLEYLHIREQLDLESASDFVSMAAHLVYIKTKMLLQLDDAETQEEMEQLIKSLEERSRMIEYQKMQFGVEYLGNRSDIGRKIFVKQPEPIETDNEYAYVHSSELLPEAMLQMRLRTKQKLPPPISSFKGIVGKEEYPVSAKITEIIQRFIFTPVTRLKQLVSKCRSRSEIVATFLAVLELCKDSRAEINQSGDDFDIIYKSDTKDARLEI